MTENNKNSAIAKILGIAISILGTFAAYGAYSIYEHNSIQNAEFETWVFNISDEDIGTVAATQNDNNVNIASGMSRINSLGTSHNDYATKNNITLRWHFVTTDHGQNLLLKGNALEYEKMTCYSTPVQLPKRTRKDRVLMIGVYNRDTLRIRWSDINDYPMSFTTEELKSADSWKLVGIPLSSNWRKKIKLDWPEMPEWNEAIDGPKYDQIPDRAWITVKADTTRNCR